MRRLSVIFLSFFFISQAHGERLLIKDVKVLCDFSELCSRHQDKFTSLLWREIESEDLKDNMRGVLVDSSIGQFSYEVLETLTGHVLLIRIAHKKTIEEINLHADKEVDFTGLKGILPFGKGKLFSEDKMDEALVIIDKFLTDKGYGNNSVTYKKVINRNLIRINFLIDTGKVIRVRRIDVASDNKNYVLEFKNRFAKFRGGAWDRVGFMVTISKIRDDLFKKGHLFSKVEVLPHEESKEADEVTLRVKISLGDKYHFYFRGNRVLSRQELSDNIVRKMKAAHHTFSEEDIRKTVIESYEEKGLYGTKVFSRVIRGKNISNVNIINYYIDIEEGRKIVLEKFMFNGNVRLSDEQLNKIYYKNASVKASRDFYDQPFLEDFSNIIRNEYLKRGYIFAKVSAPKVVFSQDKKRINVEYQLNENRQCKVLEINLLNLPPKLEEKIKKRLVNKERRPFNVTDLNNDLNEMISIVKSEGYYFAKINNLKSEDLVVYSENFTSVSFNVDFSLGSKIKYHGSLITGNVKTRLKVIQRESEFVQGEVVTPAKINKLKNRLVGLGIFSYVKITPVVVSRDSESNESSVNLLIAVSEVDFGVIEIAPGYRTDIGVKASTMVRYNNWGGMNRVISVKLQGNQRLDFDNLDERRRKERQRVIEYIFKVDFAEPYLFPRALGRRLEFDASVSSSTKRFYGFDANIFRGMTQVAKKYTDHFSAALKYQWEYISQYDATEERDRGDFRIGSLTPSVTFDFRNDKINPRKGLAFGLSYEYAHPAFGSMSNTSGVEINYYKLVSRNKAYLPIHEQWGLAFSLAFGRQKHIAVGRGYIPSIKVFRLNGPDVIRGFEDYEINRLSSGQDISEVVIRENAFFSAFKTEIRHFINENAAIGLFYDAGHIDTEGLEFIDLRKSAGITFKFLTPVGSLDFDYGVKLRRREIDGGRESFGKFHLSIGFF